MAITINIPKRAETATPVEPAKKQSVTQEVKQPEVASKEPINQKELDNG